MNTDTREREIKFRAWSKANGEIIYLGELHNQDLGKYYEGWVFDQGFKEGIVTDWVCAFELMQYTGLKDKNGTDIYEGDIDGLSNGVIEFNTETCCYILRRINGTFIRLEVRKNNVEIIGNIYSNPELLKPST